MHFYCLKEKLQKTTNSITSFAKNYLIWYFCLQKTTAWRNQLVDRQVGLWPCTWKARDFIKSTISAIIFLYLPQIPYIHCLLNSSFLSFIVLPLISSFTSCFYLLQQEIPKLISVVDKFSSEFLMLAVNVGVIIFITLNLRKIFGEIWRR